MKVKSINQKQEFINKKYCEFNDVVYKKDHQQINYQKWSPKKLFYNKCRKKYNW